LEEWSSPNRGNFRRLDILVNNAAILIYGNIENTNLADWQKIQRINSDGYFLGCHYGLAAMKKRGGGSIVNMSSMAGIAASARLRLLGEQGCGRGDDAQHRAHCRMNLLQDPLQLHPPRRHHDAHGHGPASDDA